MILLVFIIGSILIFNIAKAQNETSNETQIINKIDVLENVTNNETVDNKSSSEDFVLGGKEILELNETVENVTSNISVNETLENITNETSNETSQIENTNENTTSNETQPVLKPVFDVNLEYLEKITRRETVNVKAVVKNIGSLAKSVSLEWVLPSGFEIVSGNEIELCGDLNTDGSCSSEIGVRANLSAVLGLNEIRVVVSYEE